MVGVIFTCLLVRLASSMAVIRPAIVTRRAVVFIIIGIVMTGVFIGRKFCVIISPAMILPQASRLMELITNGLFSLIGDKGKNRGVPMVTKYTSRKLYTAVNDVATNVRVRAQAFRYEVFRASMIESFEKNPARNGVPVRARLPIVK